MHSAQTCSTAASGCLQPASHLLPFRKQTVHTSACSTYFYRVSMRNCKQEHDAALLLKEPAFSCLHRKIAFLLILLISTQTILRLAKPKADLPGCLDLEHH